MPDASSPFRVLNDEIVACRKCPRLVKYREKIAREKRRAYREWAYWANPVPGVGDAQAQLLILGLAPAAHGANRTGRMFTGDRSGDFFTPRCTRQASPVSPLPITARTACS